MRTETKIGPETSGIRVCLECGQAILPGEEWFKTWSPDGSYATGLHAEPCAVRNGGIFRGEHVCKVCGYGTRPAAGLAPIMQHMATAHGLTGQAAARRVA